MTSYAEADEIIEFFTIFVVHVANQILKAVNKNELYTYILNPIDNYINKLHSEGVLSILSDPSRL